MTLARTYLDHNATAPLRHEAREAMLAALDVTGNASSVHGEGRRARSIVETAREQVAALVNAKPSEVVFTSGATEANVWALSGAFASVAVCGIEHDSVLAPLRACGARIADIPADADGVARIAAIADARPNVALITLQWANNETGVVQPVLEAAKLACESGCAFHTDAVQAAGRVDVDFAALGATTMSLSAHKLGGPKGIGALVIRDGVTLRPLVPGGGQERRRRGGTENIAGIAGFGAAAVAAKSDMSEWQRIAELRDTMEIDILHTAPSAVIIGRERMRLPNTTCVAVPGQFAETLVIKFDLAGIAVSAGAACSSGKVGASHVLTAMGLAPEFTSGAVRISLGPGTSKDDIARFLDVWKKIAGTKTETRMVA